MTLIIRDAQMQVFARVREDQFRREAVEYLVRSFPQVCAAYPDQELTAAVELALQRTAGRRIHRRADILRWLTLMLALGFDFDTNPDYPWVQEILKDPEVHPDAVMKWLTGRAIRHLKPNGD